MLNLSYRRQDYKRNQLFDTFVIKSLDSLVLSTLLIASCAQAGSAQFSPVTDKIAIAKGLVAPAVSDKTAAPSNRVVNNRPANVLADEPATTTTPTAATDDSAKTSAASIAADELAKTISTPAATDDPAKTTTPGDASSQPAEKNIMQHAPYDNSYDKWYLFPMRYIENYCSIGWKPDHTWTDTSGHIVRHKIGSTVYFDLQPPAQSTKEIDPLSGYNNASLHHNVWQGNGVLNQGPRELQVFSMGTMGQHLSHFIEMLPLEPSNRFWPLFEITQLNTNWGTATDNLMIRGGRIQSLKNAGFASMDRNLSFTRPLVLGGATLNNWDPQDQINGVSLEYTHGSNPLVGKVVGWWRDNNPGPSADTITWNQVRGIELTAEKVMSSTTLSGIQTSFAHAWMPAYDNTTGVQQPVRNTRWFISANKAFNDKEGFERLNFISGLGLLHDNRWLAGTQTTNLVQGMSVANSSRMFGRTSGYGYWLETDAFIIPRYLTAFVRYDQLRPYNHTGDASTPLTPTTVYDVRGNSVSYSSKKNSQYALSVGVILKLPGPFRSYGHISFDYRVTAFNSHRGPTNQFWIGFWPMLF